MKKISVASDVALLASLGHSDRLRIVERLARGPAKQKQLIEDLEIPSPSMSRMLGDLSRARLVSQDREGTHDPYWLVRKERTEELLDLAALLAAELSAAHAARAAAQAEVDAVRLNQRKARRDP